MIKSLVLSLLNIEKSTTDRKPIIPYNNKITEEYRDTPRFTQAKKYYKDNSFDGGTEENKKDYDYYKSSELFN